MKIGILISLIGAFFLLTACPGDQRKSALELIQDNGMDFPDMETRRFFKVTYQLSRLFDKEYSVDYALQDNAAGFVIYELDVRFSIERFDSEEAEMIQYAFDDEISAIDAIHDNYILKRRASLKDPDVGLKKELPETVIFPGFIQVVDGARSDYGNVTTYMTATLEIGGEYYVVQLIGREENMGYLYDDFIDILSSLHL